MRISLPPNYTERAFTDAFTVLLPKNVLREVCVLTALLHKLQQLVYNAVQGVDNNIDTPANERYATLLDEYVLPLLIAQAFDILLMQISFKVRNTLILRNTDNGVQYAPIEDIRYLQSATQTNIAEYSTRVSHSLGSPKRISPMS